MLTGQRVATPTTPDLQNARLAAIVVAAIGLTLAGIIALPGLPADLDQPGSPLLQGVAIFGSILLLGSFTAILAKRSGHNGKVGFHMHVWLSAIGSVLVAVHSTGTLTEIPSLLLISLLALTVLGLWSRFRGAQRMAKTFGTKRAAFSPPDTIVRDRLEALIGKKRELLQSLAPGANEGTFSLSAQNWRTRPFASFTYHRLVIEEDRLVGARVGMHPGQAYWRLAHRLLALGFIIGLMIHVLTVTFVAGYVAEGREIYWWHLLDWGS